MAKETMTDERESISQFPGVPYMHSIMVINIDGFKDFVMLHLSHCHSSATNIEYDYFRVNIVSDNISKKELWTSPQLS